MTESLHKTGARYTNMYQQLIIHPDSNAIVEASSRFVDEASNRLATALIDPRPDARPDRPI